MVGNGSRRGDTGVSQAISSRNVFAALDTLKKKKRSDKEKCKVKEEPAPHVFWAPAPLTVKSWADVEDDDDDDYYATTAPPSAWGVPEQKKSKEVPVAIEEESASEDEGLDEPDDEAVDEQADHQLEVPAPAEPDVKKPPVPSVPKDTERQLSKKELKKKELAELEALLTELGMAAEDNQAAKQNGTTGVGEEKLEEHSGANEKKENVPVESKTSKKKKAKKEKLSKEAKDSNEHPNGNGADAGTSAEVTARPVDMKERLKKMASTKKKSSKEMDSAARAAAVEAAARSAKLAAAKKKEKSHYNQQPMR
uniref:M355 n=1 Tax=Lilium longiflorum TaxID=4690 RepID=Q7XA59_LILLO|nr:M355 [Lilium longiflorum]